VGGEEIFGGSQMTVRPPHELSVTLGTAHLCSTADVEAGIIAAVDARRAWAVMDWTDRAAIFLRAAELLAGPWRDTMNAATMLGQSKNAHQAEIDAACEMIDFLRYNVYFAQQIYSDQPVSAPGTWNQLQYRSLEGFVFAVTPFNFASIQGNLPTAPALMGNTVVWKPATSSLYSAYFMYRLLEEAGVPPGVINMVPGRGASVGDPVLASEHLAGLHFTGSTSTFQHMWRTIGGGIENYRTYPRIVGETGGKDFIIAHESADPRQVATAIVRGGFEYQGQKCSAASRVYLPKSKWPEIQTHLMEQLQSVKMGGVEDFSNFVNAVIDASAYRTITEYIVQAQQDDGVTVLHGGGFSDEEGYFIEPTVLLVDDPHYRTMCEEIFGPVVSVFLYDESRYEETLRLVDATSPYALTGAVFAYDRNAVILARDLLVDSAGNFYVNDKPTGAVVGQQPFGGARASGTNDKAGSYLNLVRWTSARAIKETLDPPLDYQYPFLESDS
jgi:1-pyrroline-5-carboxylate dehydrogenase